MRPSLAVLLVLAVFATAQPRPDAAQASGLAQSAQYSIFSKDGRYGAAVVSTGRGDLHYRVDDLVNGATVLETNALYSTPNDVKAGVFLEGEVGQAQRFAAAYHYG